MLRTILQGLKALSGGILCLLLSLSVSGQTWVVSGTDAAGDAQASGLDGIKLEYAYDKTGDKIMLKVTVSDLLPFASSPSADFSFFFPEGVDGNEPTGTHWTAPSVPVHKTITMYADKSGSAPSNYTWTSFPPSVAYTGGSKKVLCTGCVSIETKTSQNEIIYTLNRKSLITDTELGSDKKVTLTVVANVGHDIGWDDNLTKSGTMTIDVNASDPNVGVGSFTTNNQKIQVYPNPNQGIIQVKTIDPTQLVLYSIHGTKLMEWNADQEEMQLDLTEFQNGVYIIQGISMVDGSVWTQKISMNK